MVPEALTSHPRIDAVVIGGSAGSVAALDAMLPCLPVKHPPVLVVVHVLATAPSLLAPLFAPRCAMRVVEADLFQAVEWGSIYFAPANYHLLVGSDGRCALSTEPPVHFSRPSIDVLFESAAHAYGPRVAGIVLTGASADGALGLAAIRAGGGFAFVQEPSTAESRTMPEAAIAAVPDARVVGMSGLLSDLRSLVRGS